MQSKKSILLHQHQSAWTTSRSRLSGSAKSLTFGAQTGRGSEKGCVIRRTQEPKCAKLIQLVHSLAQSTESSLLYIGFQVLMREEGQDLNQHRDYHNHPDLRIIL